MAVKTKHIDLQKKIMGWYEQNQDLLNQYSHNGMETIRKDAINSFEKNGLPTQALENWKNTSLDTVYSRDYKTLLSPLDKNIDINKIFRCAVHNFETYLFTQLNGWYVYKNKPLTVFDNGVIVGSMAAAMREHHDVFFKHYAKYVQLDNNGLDALNTAFAQDGFFIYVPDNVVVDKAIQIVSIVNHEENLLVNPRNLVILGKNAELTLVHCDDSIEHEHSFINTVSEVFIDKNASLNYYKLQNKDDESTVITNTYFHQEADSRLNAHTLTFNGGIIRNDIHSRLNESGAEANFYGLYLMDRKQHVDNRIHVDHAAPNTYSNELYKGILDDEASAVFNGHVLVRKDAQKINAFQNNKNILLTDNAKVNTKPFLEIYADDVKCSHGATIGQLDPEAMFYLKSRGICERNAKMLLMYAFANEVAEKIKLEALRERTEIMIEKRLKGELSICDACNLHCGESDIIEFKIDLEKI